MVGGVDMGVQAERDLMAEYRNWFDFWLKKESPVAPDSPGVELYLMGGGRWLASSSYPLNKISRRRLYLSGRDENERVGRLEWESPKSLEAFDTFTYSPGQPTPSYYAALKRGRIEEYRRRAAIQDDVISYESAPAEERFYIVGSIRAVLYASSSARDTDWTATLYAVDEAERSRPLGLTFGILRARYRDSMKKPSLLEPGEVNRFQLDLGHTAVVLEPGERLHLDIASAAFPDYSRNLNTGGDNELETDWVVARQRIYRSPVRPSHLLLPILEKAPE